MSTTTKERPILFSGPMVRAILEGRKTQTRRVVKGIADPESFEVLGDSGAGFLHSDKCQSFCDYACGGYEVECPYGKPGDRLWVREAWWKRLGLDADGFVGYVADLPEKPKNAIRKVPSIHMPRWASRLTLEITGVRVERLLDISEADCAAEGVVATFSGHPISGLRYEYWALWDSINGPGSWSSNPWVWVVEFRRLTP